jgi:hypothetical protein
MNERIRELADKIWEEKYWTNPNTDKLLPAQLNRFAELIVGECLEACSRANEIRHFVPPTQEQVVLSCMREIEEHFGVEE